MSKQEQSDTPEVVDKRMFDDEGEVRDEVVENRDAEELEPEELTLELLNNRFRTLEGQTIEAMKQVDTTFEQIYNEFNQLTAQIRTTISDMHVRLGVLEEININPALADDRKSIQDGTFTMDRFKAIAEEYVIPEMKIQAEKAQAEMKDRFDRMQAAIQSGMSPEDALKLINEEDEAKDNKSDIEIVSG